MSMRNLGLPSLLWLSLSWFASPPTTAADDAAKPIHGIGPAGPTVKLHTGFQYLDGIAADRQGNVYFSDIPGERIYKVDSDGKLSVFLDKSHHANGLKVNAKGEVFVCEMDGRVVAVSPTDRKLRVIAGQYQGKRFNAPNDLVIDKNGGVYFSDPSFLAPEPLPQGKTCVYCIALDGKVKRLIDNLTQPNGVILSLDEKTLYVIPTGPAEMMAYPIEEPGKLGPGRVFCTLRGRDGKPGTGGDGLTIDAKGNLYITSELGIQIFDTSGKFLGLLSFPEQPANATFGGVDRKTLYVTARTSLYTVRMEATGHVFAAGKE
jgi:gluconolactonase